MAALGREALLDAKHEGTRAELRFAAGTAVRARVDVIVAAEPQCCAFLTMRVTEPPDMVVLRVDAPAGAERVRQELLGAFGDQPQAV